MNHTQHKFDEALELLKQDGQLPARVRFCVGTRADDRSQIVNKRLFSGANEVWLEAESDREQVSADLEGLGYARTAEQTVPDGFGTSYESIYYARSASDAE